MSLTIATETLNSQIPFGQIGNVISSPKVFRKKSLEQIADTEISLCNISFSDFANVFNFEIVGKSVDEFSEQLVFKLEYEDKFFVDLKLNGYWELDGEPRFQFNDVDWVFEEKVNSPTYVFLLETFKAICCLSEKVKIEIPDADFYFKIVFSLPLNNISEILQTRQIAYRLMVIEKALNISLPFPRKFIKGEELENIAFCYHAIVDREFDWFANPTIIPWESSKESLSWLPEKNEPSPIIFRPESITNTLFS